MKFSLQESFKNISVSYWKIFRLIFVIFSLYLMGDALFRWDAFRYYASLMEFLTTCSLVTVLWTIIAALVSLLILFAAVLILLAYKFLETFLVWLFRNKSKLWIRLIRQGVDRTGQLLGYIQERITPLVWLFSLWMVISVPLVVYQTWGGKIDETLSQQTMHVSESNENRPNIIFVSFDALRARNMSVYGYNRQTTPFLSEWARKTTVFSKAEAASLNTFQATPCMMTGKRVWSNQIYHEYGNSIYEHGAENLPALLKKQNYYNIIFSANPIANAKKLGINKWIDLTYTYTEFVEPPNPYFLVGTDYARINIELYRLFAYKIRMFNWIVLPDFILGKILFSLGYFGDFDITPYHPQKVFNKFLEVVDNDIPKPYFAWLHLYPPHFPYLSPPPYMGMFEPSDKYRTYKAQKEAKNSKASDAPTILRGRYDELIRYCDKQFEEFIKTLDARGKLKNTIIIVSSDHGESFERGAVITHGTSLYEESTNIPLIIKEPGQKEGRVIGYRVSQIDIPATIVDLAGISLPKWIEGRSLKPLMRDKTLPPKPIFSMDLQTNMARGSEISKGTIAVWKDDYKLIHKLEKKESLLFNLKNDPGELNNLYYKEPEAGQRLLSIIQDNLQVANKRIISREE